MNIPVKKLSNDIDIPYVGYGSYLSTEKKGSQPLIDAINAGYRYIDTAYYYFNEKEVGQAIIDSGIDRKEFFIVSKLWPTKLGYDSAYEYFKISCDNLKTDYLDLYLIHWPKVHENDDNWKEKIWDTWKAFEKLYESGKIRAIGVSNFLPHHMDVLLEKANIIPMVNQLELHVGYMQEYTVSYMKEKNIALQAWSPLGRAAMLNQPDIIKMSEKYNKSTAQVLLRYLYQRDVIVIPKASSMERLKENIDIFDFEISKDDMNYLSCLSEMGFSGEHPDKVDFRGENL